MARLGSLLAVLAIVLVVAGCGSGAAAPTSPIGPAASTAAAPSPIVLLAPLPGVPSRVEARGSAARVSIRVEGLAAQGAEVLVGATGCARGCERRAVADAGGGWSTTLSFGVPANRSRISVRASYPGGDGDRSARVDVPLAARDRSVRTRPAHPPKRIVSADQPASTTGTESEGEPAGARPGSGARALVLVGDSLSVGQRPRLEEALPDWSVVVSAEIGRHLSEGMRILRGASVPAGTVVAVGLFTNDDPWRTGELDAAVRESLRIAGPSGCAIWATIASPPVEGQTYAAANRLLEQLAEREPRMRLVPWQRATTGAGMLAGDGVHPTDAGARMRAQLYARAAASC